MLIVFHTLCDLPPDSGNVGTAVLVVVVEYRVATVVLALLLGLLSAAVAVPVPLVMGDCRPTDDDIDCERALAVASLSSMA